MVIICSLPPALAFFSFICCPLICLDNRKSSSTFINTPEIQLFKQVKLEVLNKLLSVISTNEMVGDCSLFAALLLLYPCNRLPFSFASYFYPLLFISEIDEG